MPEGGVRIGPLETIREMELLEALQRSVWPGSKSDVVPAHLMITVAQNGGVVLGAWDGDRLVGFVFGFLGTDPKTPERVAMARLKHCSHMLGVIPEYRGQGIGLSLKLAQREAILKQGIRLITWTYDPLQSRNAHLNIRRLGGVARSYLREVYGKMRDNLNVGISSDRFQVEWWITSQRVVSRVQGDRPPLDLANFLAAGAQKLNPSTLGADDLVRPTDAPLGPDGNLILVEIPHDLNEIKAKDMQLAKAWREHTREIFEAVFQAGYLVTDFVFLEGERHPRSYYLLSHGEGTLG